MLLTTHRYLLLKLITVNIVVSPSKGSLPFQTDLLLSWSPHILSSLFMDIHQFLLRHTSLTGVEALIKSYLLYLDQINVSGDEPILSVTRAWFLVRFFDAQMLQLTGCTECGGHFIVHANGLYSGYVCGICRPPSRAGKTKRNAAISSLLALSVAS